MNQQQIFLQTVANSPSVAAVRKAIQQESFPMSIEVPDSSLPSVLTALFHQEAQAPIIAVVPHEAAGQALKSDLQAFGIPTLFFPWWGMLNYTDRSSLSTVFNERVLALTALVSGKKIVIIMSIRAFLTPLPPLSYFRSLLFTIHTGSGFDPVVIIEKLSAYGYTRVPRVQMRGEFAMRGEVLDLCINDNESYRLLFDFDRIAAIKRFDPVNQASVETVTSLCICPQKEVIWSDELILKLQENLEKMPQFPTGAARIIEQLIEHKKVGAEEMFFSLAFEKPSSVLDYQDSCGIVIFFNSESLERLPEALMSEYTNLYHKKDPQWELPPPALLLLDFEHLKQQAVRSISFGNFSQSSHSYRIAAEAPQSFFGNIRFYKEEITALIEQGWNIVVTVDSEVQIERMHTLFKHSAVTVLLLAIQSGFILNELKLRVIQEHEIFGKKINRPNSLKTVRSAAIDTFVDLNPEDFIVHLNYGIGRFKGIDRIKALGHERDYIKLEYAGGETIFVPIEQVNLIQRYIGNEGNDPPLDWLGSKSWEIRKNRVKKAVEDLAGKLLALYSRRKASTGFAFGPDTEWQAMFEASFPFEETEDQIRCVEEIKADMESPYPMDRLICGDVGYGKTEVALRACFKAIMAGTQVVFLAPTTILAEQHYETFIERFAQFPVRVAMLSRLVDKSVIKKTLAALLRGEIDLVVGTHRLLQKDVQFKHMGLMVIDEEQRFGVKDKEKLKEMKHNIDCLTLSATPIPRTLHISLLKIRDMSLLNTAPQNRHPIETVVAEYNSEQIASAIRREVKRGGQVFFLHNRIESLDKIRLDLERLVPEVLIETAHGRMSAQELENVMHRFVHGSFHVLVSTTIIENGIDIPNVNTIIIDRADLYGVSQLYQLRGRVGRSDRVAFAYLFYPDHRNISELAMKRLQVISDFTDLGSGFKIALKDMEIRGAGNLLGREQSGDIYSIGFDLYVRLLDEAVRKLEDDHYEAETESLLELEYSGFIPDNYIDSMQEKMDVYKKIAGIREKAEVRLVYAELLDRFGPMPEEVLSLLSLAEIRIICRELAVSSLRERSGFVRVEFAKLALVNIDRLLQLIKDSKGTIKVDPKAPNAVILATGAINLKEKSAFIREKLSALV
ncbi:MAG: transcription-repair coupling factor [Spirochaetaceae bacterium]|nr:transcription-repair coupling factor [Spirochaetaceae bacterium]